MMSKKVSGKVAKILNSRELVLNIGSKHGVVNNMIFNVIDSAGLDITDPDSGDIIGSLRRVKLQVKVTYVEESLSIATTFKKKEIHVGGFGFAPDHLYGSEIARLFMQPSTRTEIETLKKPDSEIAPLDEKDSIVKSGDIVEEDTGATVKVTASIPTSVDTPKK